MIGNVLVVVLVLVLVLVLVVVLVLVAADVLVAAATEVVVATAGAALPDEPEHAAKVSAAATSAIEATSVVVEPIRIFM